MSRLPVPGQDSGTWGSILNDYLSQAHKADGTIKDNAVTASSIAPGSLTQADVGLGNVDNTSDAGKPMSTATKTALRIIDRGVARRLPELYSSFVSLPNGSAPAAFETGQAASIFYYNGTENQQVINDGGLYSAWTAAGQQASYYQGQLSGTARRVGMRFKFKPNPVGGATQTGTAAMAICRAPMTGTPPMMGLHFTIYSTSVTVGVWNGPDEPGSDGLVILASWPISLKVDDRTEYEAEAWIDDSVSPARCTWELRDANSSRCIRRGEFTDARLTSYAGPHVFFEHFTVAGNTDNFTKISHVWADSAFNHGPIGEYQPFCAASRAATAANLTLPNGGVPTALTSTIYFVAPPSGVVKVQMSCYLNKGSTAQIMLYAALIANAPAATVYVGDFVPSVSGDATSGRQGTTLVCDGLTPGATYACIPQVYTDKTDTVLVRNQAGYNAYASVEPVSEKF